MTTIYIISSVAAVASLGMGFLGLLAPFKAIKLAGLQPDPAAPHAVSEVRATFGGLFIAMSLLALVTAEPLAYATVGAAWFGAGAARFVSIAFDRIPTPQNFGAAMFESGLGLAILLWPWMVLDLL